MCIITGQFTLFFPCLAFSGGAAVKRQKNGYEWMKSVHFEKWGWGLKNVTLFRPTDRPTLWHKLFYFILFCFIMFYFIFCFVLFYFILFCFIFFSRLFFHCFIYYFFVLKSSFHFFRFSFLPWLFLVFDKLLHFRANFGLIMPIICT